MWLIDIHLPKSSYFRSRNCSTWHRHPAPFLHYLSHSAPLIINVVYLIDMSYAYSQIRHFSREVGCPMDFPSSSDVWRFPEMGGTLRINLNRCFYSKTIQLLGYHGVPLWKATFLDVFQLVTMVFSQVLLAAKAASSASSSCSSNWDATELLQSQISKASTWLEVWVGNFHGNSMRISMENP